MKKILTILLLLPFMSFGQTAKEDDKGLEVVIKLVENKRIKDIRNSESYGAEYLEENIKNTKEDFINDVFSACTKYYYRIESKHSLSDNDFVANSEGLYITKDKETETYSSMIDIYSKKGLLNLIKTIESGKKQLEQYDLKKSIEFLKKSDEYRGTASLLEMDYKDKYGKIPLKTNLIKYFYIYAYLTEDFDYKYFSANKNYYSDEDIKAKGWLNINDISCPILKTDIDTSNIEKELKLRSTKEEAKRTQSVL